MKITNAGGIFYNNTNVFVASDDMTIKNIDIVSFATDEHLVILKREADIAFATFELSLNESQSKLSSTFIKKGESITVECTGEVHITLSIGIL